MKEMNEFIFIYVKSFLKPHNNNFNFILFSFFRIWDKSVFIYLCIDILPCTTTFTAKLFWLFKTWIVLQRFQITHKVSYGYLMPKMKQMYAFFIVVETIVEIGKLQLLGRLNFSLDWTSRSIKLLGKSNLSVDHTSR